MADPPIPALAGVRSLQPRRFTDSSRRITTHSSRRRFAARLNSGVRRVNDAIRQLVDQMAAPNQRNPLIDGVEEKLCSAYGLTRHALFDEIARHIATEFIAGHMDFWDADAAANDLFAYSCHIEDPLEGFAWAVFLAFDAGEHLGETDEPDTDLVKMHTIPQLQQALAAYGSHA